MSSVVLLMNIEKNFKGTCYVYIKTEHREKIALKIPRRVTSARIGSRVAAILVVRKGIKMPTVGRKKKIQAKDKRDVKPKAKVEGLK